jgi:hypothetical protein
MKPMPEGSDLSPLFEERERERVNGEEGVIGGGGIAGEELSVIVRERGEERREEKGRKERKEEKEEKKKLQRRGCRAVARPPPRCQGWWPSHPFVPKGVAFFFFFFLVFFFFSFLNIFLKNKNFN